MKSSVKHTNKSWLKLTRLKGIVAAVLIGIVGVVAILVSNAAPYTASVEPENGSISFPASKISNGSASGGSALKFGAATPAPTGYLFPLKVSSNGRYLVDQNGKPFYYMADTGWTMMSKLSIDQAKQYIDARKSQGFNTIQTILTGWGPADNTTRGMAFSGGNITQPVESYFAGVDQIMDYAESQGMLLYAVPLWMANNGGWAYAEYGDGSPAPSASAMTTYMSWIGNRYKNQPNIVWVMGGDDETNRNADIKKAGANALNSADTNHIITYHPRWDDYGMSNEGWHDFNAFQKNDVNSTYNYQLIRTGYDRSPTKPILQAEPPYEPSTAMNPGVTVTAADNRRFGWWAALAGAMGVTYGHSYGGSWGISQSVDWNSSVNRSQAKHSGNIRLIMEKASWHRLVPDWGSATVTGGRGTYGGSDYAPAGRADDGSSIVAYAPSSRTFTVDKSKLSGAGTAQWYDPTTGSPSGAAIAVSNSGSQTFATPGNNAGGNSDWVLIINKN